MVYCKDYLEGVGVYKDNGDLIKYVSLSELQEFFIVNHGYEEDD